MTSPTFAEASRSLLRDTILGALDRLLAARAWSDVTMAAVAAEAGVSRQTVYNEFGNRATLAQAYASWAGDQLLDEVERCVAEHRHDLLSALTAAFTVFLDVGAEHPLVRSLAARSGDDDLLAALATGQRSPIVDGATERLGSIILATWPHLPGDAVVAISDVLVRVAISHLLLPTSSPEVAVEQVSLVLAPFLSLHQGAANR